MIKSRYLKFISAVALVVLTLSGCNGVQKNQGNVPSNKTPTAQQKASYYYTANEGGSVSKIDVSTNKVINTINLDGAAHNVQVSPDGKILGITMVNMKGDTDGGTMDMDMNIKGFALFYDTETDKTIKRVQVGKHPAHIVFTPDGKYVLVTNNGDNNVSLIDAQNYNVLKSVPTGKEPHGFRISKDGKFAYIANMGEDTVSVIDIANFKELKRIKVGNTPVTTGITSDKKTLVTALNGENALAIVDLNTDKVEKVAVGSGPAQVFIQSDDKYAFVANQGTKAKPSNTVSKIDLATRKVVATINTGKGSHGVVTSVDNKFIYVTNMYDNTVSVIDNNQNNVAATIPVGVSPNGITYKP